MCRIADLLPYGCGPQPPPIAPPLPPPPPAPSPPPPPVTCSGATYAFDDAPGTYVIGYTSLPSSYGAGALNWTNWNAINGTLWGSVRSLDQIWDSCSLERDYQICTNQKPCCHACRLLLFRMT